MDRTDELVRATQLFQSIDRSKSTVRGGEPSPFLTRSNRVSVDLEQNGNAERKEFSNDPIHEMKRISSSFQTNITNIESDIVRLKKEVDIGVQGNTAIQHRKLILEYLEKLMRRHVSSFKDAVKTYTANVEQRNKRVGNKYGQVAGISSLTNENAAKYAMFSAPLQLGPAEPDVYSVPGNAALRNRRGGASVTQTEVSAYVAEDFTDEVTFGGNSNSQPDASSTEDDYENDKKYGKGGRPPPAPQPAGSAASSGGYGSSAAAPGPFALPAGGKPYSRTGNRSSGAVVGGGAGQQGQQAQVQVQQKGRGRELDRYRLQQAQQAESTIAQMGQLFAQMATLVSEQSETIARIEDDVEAGLQDTLQGQAHIQNVYDITKGNRGLILKIFALLVFFIFLFLVWT